MSTTKHSSQVRSGTDTTNEAVDDYQLWLKLKPYIAHCLTMNHELSNPLTTVLGYAELLLESEPPLTGEQAEHVRAILESAERVRALVERLGREKTELSKQIDFRSVTAAYQKIAEPLE